MDSAEQRIAAVERAVAAAPQARTAAWQALLELEATVAAEELRVMSLRARCARARSILGAAFRSRDGLHVDFAQLDAKLDAEALGGPEHFDISDSPR
jgi:hypothetical protein